MSKRIGSVYLELDKKMTESSFKGLEGIVNKVANNLKPITLKLNTKETTKEFNELSKVLKDISSNINKINTSKLAGNSDGAQKAKDQAKAYKELMQVFERYQHYQKSLAKLDETKDPFGYKNAAKYADEYSKKLDEVYRKNEKILSQTQKDEFQRKRQLLNESLAETNAKGTDKALAQVNAAAAKEQAQAIRDQAAAQRDAADAEQDRANGLSSLESRILSMVSLTAVLTASVRQLRQMVQTTIELDSAMTQLRIVTNNSEAEYAAYGTQMSRTAQEIGASITDLVDSTTVFARLGYSLDESSELSRLTAMLHNVGDIDVSSAQNALTAITKAFADAGTNIEASMDKMVVVGNNFPISVAQLAEGMNNAGSALAAAGNSFDQSIALLTAANTTIQNISKSSTGLRTIAARIRKTTTELDDLGEVVNEAKYQSVLDLLTGHGVKLTENGEYRSTYDILKDIADIWDRLSSMDQAAIAEQLAGNRQQNVFYSIINQFHEAEDAMVAMQNSQGAMAAANEEFMNSIQAHINSFQAAYQQLSSTVIDSDLTKGIIDFGTSAINVLTKVFDFLDKIGVVLPAISGGLTALFSHIGGKIGKQALDGLGITDAIKNVKNLITAASGAKSLFGAEGILGTIFGSLGTAGKIGLIVTALTAAYTIIKKIAEYAHSFTYDAQVEKVKELTDSYNEMFGAGSRYDELTKKQRVLTDAEREELEVLETLNRERAREITSEKKEQYNRFRKEQDSYFDNIGYETAADGTIFPSVEKVKTADDRLNQYTSTLSKLNSEYENHQASAEEYWHGLDELFINGRGYYEELKGYEALIAGDDTLPKLAQSEQAYIKWYEDLKTLHKDYSEYMSDPVNIAKRNLEDFLAAEQAAGKDLYRDILPSKEYKKLEEDLLNAIESTTEAAEESGNKIKSASDKAKESLTNLWNAEDFADTKNELIELANSTDGISADSIIELANKNTQLKAILDETGISARFLANIVSHEVLTGDGFDLITDKALRIDAAMQAIIDRTEGAKAAIDAFNAATATDNADAATSYAQAYQKFFADWDAGRTGSTAVQAAVNTFFSPDQLEQMGWDLQTAGEQLSSKFFQAVFSTEGDPGANFASYVRDHYTEAWQDAVEITENADGTFDIAVTSAQALADAMGTDINVANAFIEAMGAWGTHLFATGEELENLATELGLVGANASSVESVVNAINALAIDGLDGTQIKATLDALSDAGYIDTSGIDNLDGKITEAVEKYNVLGSTKPDVEVTHNLDELDAHVDSSQKKIDGMHGTHITNTIEDRHITTGAGADNAHASGTKNAPGGRTLVNELGPELISQNGHAFIANGGKPAVVNLDRGAVVLNAADTRSALRGGGVSGVIGAMASGSRATFPSNYNPGGGGGGGSSSGKSSSSSSSSNSSSTKKEKTWFEQQYDYHKHLVEMDQELQSDFLDWLDEAYKKAYAEGIIDLEEYMQREEEVYKGRQDQFKDYISDLDYAIDMAKKAGANSEDVANMYQKMLDEINRALEIAFARGLDENDDYVQYLQNQWYNYYDNLKEAREDAQDDAMDAVDDLVQYRIKMLKQYIKNEVDALKERLSNLKDFYSKQKDLLKDVADTEDYLDEQAEKRKSVTDIESQLAMLDLDNSAWAQKRKAKLKEELADAQKELNKFERDHAIEVASDQLDAAYEVQERAINARIDELNDLADNPKALYDKALSDVRNNSVALYEEMIEFNNKYGLIPWLLHKVICVNNHTYMRGHLKAIYQNEWLRYQNGWCESRKNIWIAYGATLSA